MRQNRSMPPSMVVPVLIYEDVPEAVEWLCDTFGFEERIRMGTRRSQLDTGDGAVIVSERRLASVHDSSDPVVLRPPRRGEVSHSVMVRVDNVDGHYQRARGSGARILQPPADRAYGERQYAAEDLAGHRWLFSQTIGDVAPEEWGAEAVSPGG